MEGAEAALALIIIVVSGIFSAVQKSKKAQKKPARPPRPHPVRVPVKPEPFEEESEESDTPEIPESDLAIPQQENGSSRECEHGSVGGSMDITTHEGGTDFEHAKVRVKAHVRPELQQEEDDTVIGEVRRLDAKDMRRAVIVSEILKRPEERMRERRWR